MLHYSPAAVFAIFCNAFDILSIDFFMNNSYYGRKQYDNIIRLRAIESNKPVLKVSNGGKSYYIDGRGSILELKDHNTTYIIKYPVIIN